MAGHCENSGFAEGELLSTNGCIVTLARTKGEREAKGDPRLSLEERYASHEAYVQAVGKAVNALVKEGFMLQEDGDRYMEAARKKIRWIRLLIGAARDRGPRRLVECAPTFAPRIYN